MQCTFKHVTNNDLDDDYSSLLVYLRNMQHHGTVGSVVMRANVADTMINTIIDANNEQNTTCNQNIVNMDYSEYYHNDSHHDVTKSLIKTKIHRARAQICITITHIHDVVLLDSLEMLEEVEYQQIFEILRNFMQPIPIDAEMLFNKFSANIRQKLAHISMNARFLTNLPSYCDNIISQIDYRSIYTLDNLPIVTDFIPYMTRAVQLLYMFSSFCANIPISIRKNNKCPINCEPIYFADEPHIQYWLERIWQGRPFEMMQN